MRVVILALIVSLALSAQHGAQQYGPVTADEIAKAATLPASCRAGQVVVKTGAAAGLYVGEGAPCVWRGPYLAPDPVTGSIEIGTTVTGAVGKLRVVGGEAGGTGVINSSFINPADSDMWIKIRSGATQDQRAYLVWYDYTETMHKWVAGRNAQNYFVLFDADASTHRLIATTGAETFLDSAGTAAVIINGNGDVGSGTGGLWVSGGGESKTPLHKLDANGIQILSGSLYVSPTVDGNANIFMDGGKTTARTAYLFMRDQGADKWFIGKHDSNNFKIYNYGAAAYALDIDTATNAATFGGIVQASGYRSSDGTAGATVTTCSSFKNGLCVAGT